MIYKLWNGTHIDLARVLSVSKISCELGGWEHSFSVKFQLSEHPVYFVYAHDDLELAYKTYYHVTGYSREEHKEAANQLIKLSLEFISVEHQKLLQAWEAQVSRNVTESLLVL